MYDRSSSPLQQIATLRIRILLLSFYEPDCIKYDQIKNTSAFDNTYLPLQIIALKEYFCTFNIKKSISNTFQPPKSTEQKIEKTSTRSQESASRKYS